MNKHIIPVPKGIRFLSQWEGFTLPNHPCIINKVLPGCGFTEYCIKYSPLPVILCSPRIALLSNKAKQHVGELFYYKLGDTTETKNFDKDISNGGAPNPPDISINLDSFKSEISSLNSQLLAYVTNCTISHKAPKIIVTYDSFRKVRELLDQNNLMSKFYVVVDEMQSVFIDSRFKSNTELEFVTTLQGIQNLSYVSATPMMERHLDQLPEFGNLPYYELDWASLDPMRVMRPDLSVKPTRSILATASAIIETYKKGEFDGIPIKTETGEIKLIQSKEAVFYVNSVDNICDIIRKNELQINETNIICAKTSYNLNRIKKKLGKAWEIGEVPIIGETNKMYTFCTRTVYLGADFYSDNARTFILSDANIDSLSVDISLDLPQILGRQRLNENPWKNRAEFYYKTLNSSIKETNEDYENKINNKIANTKNLLDLYKIGSPEQKIALVHKFLEAIKNNNYKSDYISINMHNGNSPIPVFNNIVYISELRAFEIQQIDYADRFSVFTAINQSTQILSGDLIINFLKEFSDDTKYPSKPDKLRYLYNQFTTVYTDETLRNNILEQIPDYYKKIYTVLGLERMYATGFVVSDLNREYNDHFKRDDRENLILKTFQVGQKYRLKDIKNTLKQMYSDLGLNRAAKANDLMDVFVVKTVTIYTNTTSGKLKENGFEILGIR